MRISPASWRLFLVGWLSSLLLTASLPAQNGLPPCEAAASLLETLVDGASPDGDVKISLQTLRVVRIERDHLTGEPTLREFLSWDDTWETQEAHDRVSRYLEEFSPEPKVQRYRCKELRPKRSDQYYQVTLYEMWPGIWHLDLEYFEQKKAGGWGEELVYVLDEDGKWQRVFQFFWNRAE